MKNTKKTQKNAENLDRATAKAFSPLVQDFSTAYNNRKDKNDPVFVSALQKLSTACAYSVLKKCIATTADKKLSDVRQDMTAALQNLSREEVSAAENLGIGVDLVSVATVAILDETKKQKDRDPALGCDLERPYTVRTLDKRVYIQTATSCAWKDKETAPIKEIYRAVRRYIMETAAERGDPRAKCCYIEDFAKDENGNETADRIYYRLGKYSDLGGWEKDFNGKETYITADKYTAKESADLVAKMNLTARQAQILKYRRQGRGYGYKAIATALGVSPQAIAKTVKQMQEKARAIGLDPEKTPR